MKEFITGVALAALIAAAVMLLSIEGKAQDAVVPPACPTFEEIVDKYAAGGYDLYVVYEFEGVEYVRWAGATGYDGPVAVKAVIFGAVLEGTAAAPNYLIEMFDANGCSVSEAVFPVEVVDHIVELRVRPGA